MHPSNKLGICHFDVSAMVTYTICCEEKGGATSKFGSWWIKCEFMDVKCPNWDFNYTNHLIGPFPWIHPLPCAFRSIHCLIYQDCLISFNSCISLVFENLLFKKISKGSFAIAIPSPPPLMNHWTIYMTFFSILYQN